MRKHKARSSEAAKKKPAPRANGGFTLLEAIVVLLVSAILGTILIQLLGTCMIKSATPVIRVQKHYALAEVTDKITAGYKKLMATDSATALEALKGYVENGNIPDNDPYYGEYTWETKYIAFDPSTNKEKPGSEGDTVLKVTISKDDQTFIALFTK